jgi:hypothetical protein
MAEQFHAYGQSMEGIKMEEMHDGQHHDELSYQQHADSSYHPNLVPTWPGRREVDHLNDYMAFYYQQAPLQSDQEKISQIQQFNQMEVTEFMAFLDRHYPIVGEHENHHGSYVENYENDNVYSGQLEPSPSTASRFADLAVGPSAQASAGSAMMPSHSHLSNHNSNRKKAYDAFRLPQFLRPAPYVPPHCSDFVSNRVTVAKARAAQYAYYKALRDQTEQDVRAMGSGILLVAGAASLLEPAHEVERPQQQRNAPRRKRGKRASGGAVQERPLRTRKGRSGSGI